MYTKFLLGLVFCAVIASLSSKHIDFTDCGSKEIKFIDIDPCSSSPCDLSIGDFYTISIQFTPNNDSSTLQLTGTAKLPDGESYPLPVFDLCASQRGLCPLKAGITIIARKVFHIPEAVPAMSGVKIRDQLVGDEETQLACADFIVNLVS